MTGVDLSQIYGRGLNRGINPNLYGMAPPPRPPVPAAPAAPAMPTAPRPAAAPAPAMPMPAAAPRPAAPAPMPATQQPVMAPQPTPPVPAGPHSQFGDTPYTGPGRSDREQQIRALGYTGAFGGGAADNWLTQNYGSTDPGAINAQPGIVPATHEPLNSTQQAALMQIINGAPQFSMAPQQLLDQASGILTGVAGKSYNPGMASAYSNPFEQQVIDPAIEDMRREHDMRDLALRGSSAHSGGFGSTAQGVNEAANDRNFVRDAGTLSSNLRSQNFSTAINQSQNQFNTDTARQAAVASNLAGLAPGYTNLSNANRAAFYEDTGAKLGAGGQIQGDNQATLDAIEKQRRAAQAWLYSQLDFLTSILGKQNTGQTTTGTAPPTPLWQRLIGGGLAGSAVGGAFGGGSMSGSAGGSNLIGGEGTDRLM